MQFIDSWKQFNSNKKVIKSNKKAFNKNLIMCAKEEENFQLSNICWICDKLFDVTDNKVGSYSDITGKYRGSAHCSCNISFKLTKKIPVIFHNLRGYDSHLIMQEIDKFVVKINVIPNGLEQYMAFTINKNLLFITSMKFMNSSLDPLIKNLSDNDFEYLSKEHDGEFLKLVKQKGVDPYEYMDSFERFFKDKLRNSYKFFSSLKDEYISEKDYLKAIDVWNVFKMNTIGYYHDLYLKTNVLLLADVFEKLINICLYYYGLDPCHYFSSPGLSSDATLKMTDIQLELISDIDMNLFIEKGMRGGISYIIQRHSKANNKYMKCYDSGKENKYIMYYGYAMS